MGQQINEISMNGIDYIRKDSVQKQELTGDLKIVVLQRGWVMIGKFERNGSECKLHNASVIRCWGTTKGLGVFLIGVYAESFSYFFYGFL